MTKPTSPIPATVVRSGEVEGFNGNGAELRRSRDLERAPSSATTTTAALALTLGLAAAGWVVAVREMQGMDMGVATRLGSFAFFAAVWIPMTAAMMLPGAAPAVLKDARTHGRLRAVPLFVGTYLAIWALVGVPVFALYRPHGTVAAGVITIAAGAYEFTPIKQHARRLCHEVHPWRYGAHCVGSSIGLMLMMVALGVMSLSWMTVIAVIGLGQKLVPSKAFIDAPVGLAIIGLGLLILIAPSAVPGLVPAM